MDQKMDRWGIKPLTGEEKRTALQALEEAKRLRTKMLAKRGGKVFADSAQILREIREERTAQLERTADLT